MQEHLEGNFEIRESFKIVLVSFIKVILTSVQGNQGGRPDATRPAADAIGFIFRAEIALNRSKYYPTNYQIKHRSPKKKENDTKQIPK